MCTFYTESCYSALRSFCPKGQRYGSANYETRANIFILDWNENVLSRNVEWMHDGSLISLYTGDN